MRRLIILLLVVFALIGMFWPILRKFPLFRLPGDFVIDRGSTKIYLPFTSMILISVLLTLLLRMVRL